MPEPGADGLPRLPALELLLRRALPVARFPDWRRGVQAALGAGAELAPVVLAAGLLPAAPRTALCFAAPLHVVAGISRVHLPPGGWLRFGADEDLAWCAAFNQEFGSDSLRLHRAAPGGQWLLEAPFAPGTGDPAPELLLGEALQRQPATGASARALRRLGAEVEMWLASHALNRAREARGEPVLNALWFWGGAGFAVPPLLHSPQALIAHAPADAWLAGLAHHCGLSIEPAGNWRSASSAMTQSVGPRGTGQPAVAPLVVLAPDAQGASRSYWRMLEENWFAPAWQALRAGEIAGLRLQIGRTAWQVRRHAPLQWLDWRRPSWWQRSGESRPWA